MTVASLAKVPLAPHSAKTPQKMLQAPSGWRARLAPLEFKVDRPTASTTPIIGAKAVKMETQPGAAFMLGRVTDPSVIGLARPSHRTRSS